MPLLLALVFIIGLIIYLPIASVFHFKKMQKVEPVLRRLIAEHARELRIRKSQLCHDRGYGVTEDKRWIKERSFFISRVLVPAFPNELGVWPLGEKLIEEATAGPAPLISGYSTPIEYEEYVAGALRQAGWQAQTTKASGDQGVDVIAKKNGRTVVLQCKLYSKPVGNSAVQEVIAGKVFQHADHAAVVTNAGYTPAARQLASKAKIMLLHDSQVLDLDALLR